MQRWRHRRKPTCGRLIGQASQEFHPQHKDFCQQRSHLLPRQLKKARHKLSPSGLRTKCFKGDKQIRRFLAKRDQIILLGRVQIALNLNTDAVPSLITERRDSGWTASVLTTAVDSLIEYQKIARRRSSQIR
jgi:hypothetical protein